MTQDTLLSMTRTILTLVGTYLVGHAVFGHTVTTDMWTVITGAVLSIASAAWGIIDKGTTTEKLQSGLRTIVVSVGGALVSLGVINQQTWASIMGGVTAIIPMIQSQASKVTAMHLISGKATADPATGRIIKLKKSA